MIEQALRNTSLYITTPISKARPLNLNQGPDMEFDSWGIEGETVFLKIRTGGQLKLKWTGSEFEGIDPRGGYSVLRVDPPKLKKFKKEMQEGSNLTYKKEQVIEKTSQIAVVSDVEQNFGDRYEISKNLKKQVDNLFDAGYNYVMYLDFKPSKSYETLVVAVNDSINYHLLEAEGSQNSKKSLELHLNEGPVQNWCMPKETWFRLKGQTMKSPKNLSSCIEEFCKKMNLKRYAFSKSRKNYNVPNDATLKNFKVV